MFDESVERVSECRCLSSWLVIVDSFNSLHTIEISFFSLLRKTTRFYSLLLLSYCLLWSI